MFLYSRPTFSCCARACQPRSHSNNTTLYLGPSYSASWLAAGLRAQGKDCTLPAPAQRRYSDFSGSLSHFLYSIYIPAVRAVFVIFFTIYNSSALFSEGIYDTDSDSIFGLVCTFWCTLKVPYYFFTVHTRYLVFLAFSSRGRGSIVYRCSNT